MRSRIAVLALLPLLSGCSAQRNRAYFESVAAEQPAQLAAARKEGVPVDVDDLRPSPPVPAAQNAAPLYRKLSAAWKRILKDPPAPLPANVPGTPISDPDPLSQASSPGATSTELAAAEKQLREYAPAIALAEGAAKLPRCDFERDWSKGVAVLFPEFAGMKRAAKALCGKAALLVRRGRYAEAGHALKASFRIARHAGEDPGIIAMLVQSAIEATTTQAICEIVSLGNGKPEVVAICRDALAECPPQLGLARHLKGELIIQRATILMMGRAKGVERSKDSALAWKQAWDQDKPFPQKAFEAADGMRFSTLMAAYDARYLAFCRRAWPMITKREDARTQCAALAEALSSVRPQDDYASLLIPILVGDPGQYGNAAMCREARRAVTAAGLAILEVRNGTGRFPASLTEVSGLPVDPFDNKPLSYERTPTGSRVFSRGANMQPQPGLHAPTPLAKNQLSSLSFDFPARPRKKWVPATHTRGQVP